jgi:hypothetical protein
MAICFCLLDPQTKQPSSQIGRKSQHLQVIQTRFAPINARLNAVRITFLEVMWGEFPRRSSRFPRASWLQHRPTTDALERFLRGA